MFLKRRFARKSILLASASILAVALASAEAGASDLPTTKGPPVYQPPLPTDVWTAWVLGGYSLAPGTDPAVGPIPFVGMSPGPGWIAGAGVDYMAGSWAPYHISGDFRYGQNDRAARPFGMTGFPVQIGTGSPAFVSTNGLANLSEDHWLVDFAVGRDFALGSGHVQAKLGVRVAEITSTLAGNGSLAGCFGPSLLSCFTPITGKVMFQSRSHFLGVGPRAGVDGSQPISGPWTFDYMGGAAVLFGRRSLSATESISSLVTGGGGTVNPVYASLYAADNAAVFNLDAQAGISYWVNPNFKITGAYLFDGYFSALKVLDANGNIVNQNRLYDGPLVQATIHF